MKRYKVQLLIALILVSINCYSQQIKVGNKIPSLRLSNTLNYMDSVIQLNIYSSGKPTLINFWHQYCGVGNSFLLKLDSLQKNRSELQILVIGRESKSEIIEFLKGRKFRGFSLPIVSDYEKMAQLFPHLTPPHLIWVGRDGIVKAITGHEELQTVNLQRFLQNQPLNLPIKNDVRKPRAIFKPLALCATNDSIVSSIMEYCSINIVSSSPRNYFFEYEPNYQSSVASFSSQNPEDLYKFAYQMIGFPFHKSQLIFPNFSKLPDKEKHYVFEAIFKDTSRSELFRRSQNYLNQYFGTTGKRETVPSQVYVLSRTSKEDKLISTFDGNFDRYEEDGRIHFRKAWMWQAVKYINELEIFDIPVVDETGYSGKVDLDFPITRLSLAEVNSVLSNFGLELNLETRKVDKLVVTKIR